MAQQSINYEDIPGNVTLVDSNHQLATRHSDKKSDIVLIPTPSDDPDDPLNWSDRRKKLSLFCMVVYTYGVGIPSAAIYSIIPNISEETGISISQLNTGTGYFFLFLGISTFFFQPMALQYGKRNIYLFSMIATAMVCVWSPYCKTNGQWIGSKILQGFVGCPIESLCEISVSDVSFQHRLSRNMSIYAVALSTSNFVAPLVAGFICDGIGWKWVMWLCAIFSSVCFVFLFFFMEETNYERKFHLKDSLQHSTNSLNAPIIGLTNLESLTLIDEKKLETVQSNPITTPAAQDILQETNELQFESTNDDNIKNGSQQQYRTKEYIDKLSLGNGVRTKFLLPHFLLGPFKMIQFPAVLWSGFLYGSSLVWFNLLNATEATILGGAPYNFSSSMCGLAYISPTIFSVIFQFSSGYLTDWLKIALARKRGGLSYPEDRFWVLIINMVLGLLSSIGWGVGAYYGVHWFLLVFFMGILGGLGVFACSISCSYVVDSYHELDSEAMVIVIVIRNLMSFACSYGLTEWVNNLGYKKAFICSGFILFFCNGTFLVMNRTGLFWRTKTKEKYWKLVEINRKIISTSD